MNNPFDPGYLTEDDLCHAGFQALGRHIRIARTCTIMGLHHIALGDHVCIDGYCVILAGKGFLRMGAHTYIGSHGFLSAGSGIVMEEFATLAQGVRLYSRSDDYSGNHLTPSTLPAQYTGVKQGQVTLQRHVIIGSGSVVLPGATLEEGVAVGALSLVNKRLAAWGIYGGSPAKWIKERSRQLLELEKKLRVDEAG